MSTAEGVVEAREGLAADQKAVAALQEAALALEGGQEDLELLQAMQRGFAERAGVLRAALQV